MDVIKTGFIVLLSFLQLTVHAQLSGSYAQLENTHDISLSPWGPYSKKYAGISHIPDMQKGMRFDFSVFPGYYRNKALVPNVIYESGYYPWQINADMTKITYRYELEWKDKVYVDVTYNVLDSSSVAVEMQCVNNTNIPQNLSLNLIAYLAYPDIYPSVKAQVPANVQWINARDYKDLKFAVSRPSDDLVYDGWLRGEARNSDYIDGYAVAKNFGLSKGDNISFKLDSEKIKQSASLLFRYRLKEGGNLSFQTKGIVNDIIEFKGTGNFEMLQVPCSFTNGNSELLLISNGGEAIELNGFFIGQERDLEQLQIKAQEKNFSPVTSYDSIHHNIILKYNDIDNYYGVAWNFSPYMVRKFLNDELDVFFKKYVHEHVQPILKGNNGGEYSNVYMRPVELGPMGRQKLMAVICQGTKEQVKTKLEAFSTQGKHFENQIKKHDTPFANILPEGEKYVFSQKMMRAAVLSDVVYPIYTQGSYIRHFTPGKWWNSLYTWDAGFITLGLGEIDIEKAILTLNAYTTPETSQSGFIHHGSPVPVQMYAFYDIWNKTQSKELLTYFYPRLKRYYEFMAGKSGSSTTASMNSKLLKTWDYFYNSGGWDDYPPQVEVHRLKAEGNTSPVITTSHVIRTAKILRKCAQVLGQKMDVETYDKDIVLFSNALQKYSWDEQSGYFSYVVHDSLNNPAGFLRHKPSGQNFNMGLDGAYPIFSGICSQKQQDTLLDKIFSDKHMWTPAGICVVDQAAAYYRIDGYWNGAVWMSHQWFVWKTMFDLGKTDYAYKIAEKALDIWKTETDETYYTFEHFFAKSGRGAGWHQFGALSTPVMMWFSAYYKSGTVTTGFEVWIERQQFADNNSSYSATISFDNATKEHSRAMLVCMNPGFKYKLSINGKDTPFTTRNSSVLEIILPATNKPCQISIKAL